ncbi:MAG: zinc ribbon domain-containing protein [Caldimicrobium sp.]|nr:zinc ribbon domain-containing protein [Caldimicrobium sp.]MCX7873694.1 zinc ribbon domain-containing protein [Caldimicrobium sp.]MDW8093618.1 FmdB family zinc ribbon protein [Caldimicrobium sp.]
MAIYEYECLTCGHSFEVWQKITEDPLKSCERCGGEVRRLIGQTGFILKGTGWYVTDYVRKGKDQDSSRDSTKESSSNSNKDQ